MSAENVSSIKSEVNATLDDVKVWVSAMGDRGIYNGTSARLRKTAINQLETILASDEPRTVAYVLENLKRIVSRWAVKNQGTPATASAYETRVRSALTDYLAYVKSPTSFTPRVAKPRPARPPHEVASESAPSRTETGNEHEASSSPTESPTREPDLEPCRLGKDREPFLYKMPVEGICMADVQRIAMHLAAGAHDFDPGRQVVVLNYLPGLPERA